MEIAKISTKEEYADVMKDIETLLQRATKLGGFESLSKSDRAKLARLALSAEKFEDEIPLMPIKTPKSLPEMLRYKMFERGLKQKQLAAILEISEATISGLMAGKRRLSLKLARKLNSKLDIDLDFLLMTI